MHVATNIKIAVFILVYIVSNKRSSAMGVWVKDERLQINSIDVKYL